MSRVKLKDITVSITDGKHGDCKGQDNSGFYFVSCKDVFDGAIHYENSRQITKEDFLDADRRTNLAPNDILITNSGTIGRMALVKDIPETRRTTFQKSVAIVKPKIDMVLPFYLYYLLHSKVNDFINSSNGAAQKNLLLSTMRDFDLEIEDDMSTQHRIATILSRYDSLIENYQKQIKLLEEAAQRLYKEWFVDLHFPGHENTKIVDGVPEGWEKKKVGDLVKIKSGYAFKSKEWQSVGCPVVKIKDISGTFVNNDSLDCVSEEIASKAIQYSLNSGDLVIAMTGATIGKIGLITENGLYANQRVGKFFLKEKRDLPFVFCLFKQETSLKQIIQISSASSAQPNISGLQLESLGIIFNENIIDKYNTKCISFFEQMIIIQSQIRLLTEARDRLLPKLMSGEIAV